MPELNLKRILCILCLGFGLLTGLTWADETKDELEASTLSYQQWLVSFWISLEQSEVTQFRAIAATWLAMEKDPALAARGKKLLAELLKTPELDANTLWTIATTCSSLDLVDRCEFRGVYERLVKADPDNAAVLLLQLSQLYPLSMEEPSISESHRSMFLRASQARRFDTYWGSDSVNLFRKILAYVQANPPGDELLASMSQEGSKLTAIQLSLEILVSMATAAPSISYGYIDIFCRQEAQNQNHESIAGCNALAETMRNQGDTTITRMIGYAIPREILKELDPDNLLISAWQLRSDVLRIMMSCYMSPWQTDPNILSEVSIDTIETWLKNLSELGEWEGNRLSISQYYELHPEQFRFNPKKCDQLQSLDNENIVDLLDGQTPQEAWETIRDEQHSDTD